ncbi:MAG: hypothetical protein AB4372_03650 [Xenococcus sp. (in: cyanobacteria)]
MNSNPLDRTEEKSWETQAGIDSNTDFKYQIIEEFSARIIRQISQPSCANWSLVEILERIEAKLQPD